MMTDDTPGRPNAAEEPEQPFIREKAVERITPMVILGVAVGLALIALALVNAAFLTIPDLIRNAIIGLGIALILSSFGGQGNARFRGLVLTGVAAICFAFVGFLEYSDQKRRELKKGEFVQGLVDGLPWEQYRANLELKETALGGQPKGSYKFIVFITDVEDVEVAKLEVSELKENPDTAKLEFTPRASFTIPRACFEQESGKHKFLQWTFLKSSSDDEPDKIVETSSNRTIAVWPDRGDTVSGCTADEGLNSKARKDTSFALHGGNFWFFASASAQEAAAATPLTPGEIAKALDMLQADDLEIRRRARDTLSQATPDLLPQVFSYLRTNARNYRVSLGICVALTEMLRQDKALGAQIRLEAPDIELFLDFATHNDRTLRIYAGEFLYDLGSPEVTRAALRRAAALGPDPALDNARFNLVFVAQDGWRKLDDRSKQELMPFVDLIIRNSAGKEKTLEMITTLKAS